MFLTNVIERQSEWNRTPVLCHFLRPGSDLIKRARAREERKPEAKREQASIRKRGILSDGAGGGSGERGRHKRTVIRKQPPTYSSLVHLGEKKRQSAERWLAFISSGVKYERWLRAATIHPRTRVLHLRRADVPMERYQSERNWERVGRKRKNVEESYSGLDSLGVRSSSRPFSISKRSILAHTGNAFLPQARKCFNADRFVHTCNNAQL